MQDRLKEILEKLSKRLDLVTIGALVLILVATGFLYMSENSFIVPEVDDPPVNKPVIKLPGSRFGEADASTADAVIRIQDRYIDVQPKIEEDEKALRLIRTNMFDQKSVQEQGEARRELNRSFQQADALYKQKKFQESLRIVEEILAKDPNHLEARNLRDSINKQLNPSGGGEPTG